MASESKSQSDEPRNYLAAERTILAWIRTGLALMGFGFVVARFGFFLQELATERGANLPDRSVRTYWIGIGLIVLGVLVNLIAAVDYVRTVRRFRSSAPFEPRVSILSVALAIIVAGFGAAMAHYLMVAE